VTAVEAAGDCTALLRWETADDPDGDLPITYSIYRAGRPRDQDFRRRVASVQDPARSSLDDTVPWGVTSYYVVRAQDSSGLEESNWVEMSFTPEDDHGPSFPSVAATASGGCGVTVTFSVEAVCSGLAMSRLHRSTAAGFVPDVSTRVGTLPSSPHTDVVPQNDIYYYRMEATDQAGNTDWSRQEQFRVDGCGGTIPVPGEAWIQRMARDPGGLRFEILPAPGADFHRIYRGSLPRLHATGYAHAASLGPDRVEDTGDDTGNCRVDGTTFIDPTGLIPGDLYFLVVGVNGPGEGIHGTDGAEQARPDGVTLGTLDCQ
jgi:hypothetical protein